MISDLINLGTGGCGSVGRVVVSNTRNPRFKYSHNQEFISNIFTVNCWKDEKIEKEAGNGPY